MPYCSRGAAVTAWHGDFALDVDCDLDVDFDVALCSPSDDKAAALWLPQKECHGGHAVDLRGWSTPSKLLPLFNISVTQIYLSEHYVQLSTRSVHPVN